MRTLISSILKKEKTCVWTLVFAIVFLSGMYLYFVNATVLIAVAGDEIEDEIGTLSISIAELESTAIAIRNAIDLDTAKALGYREVQISQFIERQGVSRLELSRVIR